MSVFLPSLLAPTHPPTPSHPGGKPPAIFRRPSRAAGGNACRGAAANPFGDAATAPPAAALPSLSARGRGERLWPLSALGPGGRCRSPPGRGASSRHDCLCSLRSPCAWPCRGLTIHPTKPPPTPVPPHTQGETPRFARESGNAAPRGGRAARYALFSRPVLCLCSLRSPPLRLPALGVA